MMNSAICTFVCINLRFARRLPQSRTSENFNTITFTMRQNKMLEIKSPEDNYDNCIIDDNFTANASGVKPY